jgi:hypothetical protein
MSRWPELAFATHQDKRELFESTASKIVEQRCDHAEGRTVVVPRRAARTSFSSPLAKNF